MQILADEWAVLAITNPVLRGFNPDPSALRVAGDYYIATSTFEWFPGVLIHHSRDLVHYRPLAHALTRDAQLNLLGVPSSAGVWAPCLSYHEGVFYLVYTNVQSWGGAYGADTHNYLVTARQAQGPWSDPVYLHSRGFDPSLFHDNDGRKWLLNTVWDFRAGKPNFAGIEIQEYAEGERRLLGSPRKIFVGTECGITEGPHLYRRAEYYYLLTAEGGTGAEHAVTVARSRELFGPYEVDPHSPLLTSRGRPSLLLQRAGHASLFETETGEVYIAHLCGRPIGPERRCILGRETALQRCHWTADGWLHLASGQRYPAESVPAPSLPGAPFVDPSERDDFDEPALGVQYQTLRTPADPSWLSLEARPSQLRLWGREAPSSLHRQSLVARRVESAHCRATTLVDFEPLHFMALAGLLCWYDTRTHYYLAITWDEALGRCLRLFMTREGTTSELVSAVALVSGTRVLLHAELSATALNFSYAPEGEPLRGLGPSCDATLLSDESPKGLTPFHGSFTGAMFGLGVHDMSGGRAHADFEFFSYENTSQAARRP